MPSDKAPFFAFTVRTHKHPGNSLHTTDDEEKDNHEDSEEVHYFSA